MDIRKLQRAIVDGLEDVKAQDIQVFNTEHLSPLFERVIVASGTSNRQTKALAASVRDAVKTKGFPVMRTEGEDNGEWIIVDCGAAVAHIMQPAIRQYYHLEEIWGGKAVKMKFGETTTRLVKASEPEPERKPASRKSASRKSASRKAAPRNADSRKPATAPAKKKPAAPARQAAAPARKAAKPFAGRAPAKAPAKKAPARQVESRAAPAKKKAAPARKSPRRA
nr:ribosome silencing factor [uncultured Methylibium sp.]